VSAFRFAVVRFSRIAVTAGLAASGSEGAFAVFVVWSRCLLRVRPMALQLVPYQNKVEVSGLPAVLELPASTSVGSSSHGLMLAVPACVYGVNIGYTVAGHHDPELIKNTVVG
jgi:hypothetical protein